MSVIDVLANKHRCFLALNNYNTMSFRIISDGAYIQVKTYKNLSILDTINVFLLYTGIENQ